MESEAKVHAIKTWIESEIRICNSLDKSKVSKDDRFFRRVEVLRDLEGFIDKLDKIKV